METRLEPLGMPDNTFWRRVILQMVDLKILIMQIRLDADDHGCE